MIFLRILLLLAYSFAGKVNKMKSPRNADIVSVSTQEPGAM